MRGYALEGEMKEKYLLPALRGEKKACFAQTEPDAGSGEDAREDAYICKYFCNEMAFKAADTCMPSRNSGDSGAVSASPKATEVMKMVIARHVLKAYG